MSHRCPVCNCTVYGGDFCNRTCWMCEEEDQSQHQDALVCGGIMLLFLVSWVVYPLVWS